MLSAAVIDALVAAGATVEQLAAAVKADMAEAEQRVSERRAKDAERQRRHRASRSVTVTSCDTTDNPSPLTPPLKVSPDPFKESPPLTPQPNTKRTRVPADFWPVMTGITKATVDGWPPGRLEEEVEHFIDLHTSKANLSTCWQASWRTWVKNSKKWEPRNGQNIGNRAGNSASGRGRTIDAAQRFVARGGHNGP